MILVGENLPHFWRSDEKYIPIKAKSKCEAYVIHFTRDCFGQGFFNIPENRNLLQLFKKAQQGITIKDKTKSKVVNLMQQVLSAKPDKRVLLFIEILVLIANSKTINQISRQNKIINFNLVDSERMNTICQYIIQNSCRELSLKEIASVANLSPNSFCRYFKSRIRKTFSRFLIEIRIDHACKLLAETNVPVAHVCYECGYNNFSNFNNHFKHITGKTPLEFRKNHKVKLIEPIT